MTVKIHDLGDSRMITSIIADDGMGIVGKGESGFVEVRQIDIPREVKSDELNYYIELPIGTNYGGVMKYSRWGIIKALEKRGLADAFDSYLAEKKAAFRRFYGPNYFAADDADFKAMLTTLQGAFKLTDADIAAILAESPYTDD